MKILLTLSSILFLFFLIGCGSSGSSKNEASARRITIGFGGGFSGEQKGYTITADGQVSSWSRMPGDAAVSKDIFNTTPEDIRFFFRYLDEISFTSKKFSTTGNMTTSIESESGDSRHTVKWGIESVDVPCEFTNFYAMLTQFINKHSSR